MPFETKYQVDTRYTNRKALAKKLQVIFPLAKEAEFDIKVSGQWETCLLGAMYLIHASRHHCTDSNLIDDS